MRRETAMLEGEDGAAASVTRPQSLFGSDGERGRKAKMKNQTAWSLDRRVPLAVILTIATQTAAALLWAGAASERLAALETRTERIGELVERTARLEEQTKAANAALGRIEARLVR